MNIHFKIICRKEVRFMKIKDVCFKNCEFSGKRVAIEFDEETLWNGNGRDKVYITPTKCSVPQCPNIKNCIYMQEDSHWK